jgi:vitamin B12/bleomycin/antimicrobial peptide transport system ATP-binding/permease protein
MKKSADNDVKKDKCRRRVLSEAWHLGKIYWSSEEKWSAWGLLLATLVLYLANVYVSVQINEWNYHFYNSLQAFKSDGLLMQLGLFCFWVALAIGLWIYAVYLRQILQIRWRTWLTNRYLNLWLADRAYYQLELGGATDNPDQRIAEDVDRFTMFALTLFFGLIASVVSLASFLFILWGLSGSADIPLGTWQTIHIPAYLLWAALFYAVAGTWLTMVIGRPLVPLNFMHQRFEADFRFSMVRLRENAESVAFYEGEAVELRHFHERFHSIARNFRQMMRRQRFLTGFTMGYNQVAVIFPLLVVSPRYFAKQIGWGGLMQIVNAFSYVQNSLSFIVNAYSDIAVWNSTTQRLSSFEHTLQTRRRTNASVAHRVRIIRRQARQGLALRDFNVDLPNGTPLLCGVAFSVKGSESLLLTGPSGIGKSTLLRAISGIWPFASGRVSIGKGKTLFVPQRAYMPLGTLERALLYPFTDSSTISKARLAEVLHQVGLGSLEKELAFADNWSRRLSLGEQQKLALARALLIKPAYLFLDEATSALDESTEAYLLTLLRQSDPEPTIVSIGHHHTLIELHHRTLDIRNFRVPPASIVTPEEEPAGLVEALVLNESFG